MGRTQGSDLLHFIHVQPQRQGVVITEETRNVETAGARVSGGGHTRDQEHRALRATRSGRKTRVLHLSFPLRGARPELPPGHEGPCLVGGSSSAAPATTKVSRARRARPLPSLLLQMRRSYFGGQEGGAGGLGAHTRHSTAPRGPAQPPAPSSQRTPEASYGDEEGSCPGTSEGRRGHPRG